MEMRFEDHPTDPDKLIIHKSILVNIGADYERGFIDGMQKQMQSSVDRAVNAMTKKWVDLTEDDIDQGIIRSPYAGLTARAWRDGVEWAMRQLKEKNV